MDFVVNSKFKMLPARPGTCAMCATAHAEGLAHNATSLFYQVRFRAKWGRDPTWADACAHLSDNLKRAWRTAMRGTEAEWTEPVEGEPIAEPYAIATLE